MLRSSTVLPLHLPALPADHYYQLALVGAFQLRKHSSHQLAVSLYFHVKGPVKDYRKPIGATVRRSVNLNETLALIAGSLWATPGRMVSTGQTLQIPFSEGNIPIPPIDILNKVHRFSIGSAVPRVMTLAEAFPDLTRLGSKFLRTQPNIWVLVHEEAGRRFIVPCFELLRTFYYVDGRHLLDFYFSLTDLSTICVPRVWPTEENGYTAHIDVVSDHFTTHQIRVLAQLCFDPFFRKAIIKAHSDLLLGPLRSTVGAHVRLDFHLGLYASPFSKPVISRG